MSRLRKKCCFRSVPTFRSATPDASPVDSVKAGTSQAATLPKSCFGVRKNASPQNAPSQDASHVRTSTPCRLHSHDTSILTACSSSITFSIPCHLNTSSAVTDGQSTMPRNNLVPNASSSNLRSNRTTDALNVYYCLCGEFALVSDRPLSSLPLRPLDNARILRCLDSPPYTITGAPQRVRKARVFKLNATQGTAKLISRPDKTLEKQYPFNCSRCNLELGYEHTPPPLKSGGKFTFILPGALTDRQGVPPQDAFLEDFLAPDEQEQSVE